MEIDNEIPEKSKCKTFTVSLHWKKLCLLTQLKFSRAKFTSTCTSRKNWKLLFEGNFSKNYTKTIRLFALDFYEVIVDEAEGLINYYLIEILSS